MDEILWVYYSNETILADLLHGTLHGILLEEKNDFFRGGDLFAHISVNVPIA